MLMRNYTKNNIDMTKTKPIISRDDGYFYYLSRSSSLLRSSCCWHRVFIARLLMVFMTATHFIGGQVECHMGFALSEEKRLIKQLIDNYTIDGKFGRPIKAMNATLKVGYGISLVQIMDVDEKDQVLTTNVWCKYKWRDETLHWNPADHENITIVRVPINTIWKPDFVLYNYADERLSEHRNTMALIDPEGYVTYIPPAIFKSTCFIDTTYFPFDEQSCHLKFGSWTYNGNALDPFFIDDKEFIELSEYVASQEWVILEHGAIKNVAFYECCPNEPYPDLTFHLKLRRRATFYSYTLILPCVLLSFITMVLFMLPPETPAKMLLGINIFVAFFMLLLLLKESTPPTAKQIPIIGAYYCFNMVMTTVSTFLCAILVDMHFRADKRNPPSRWVTTIVINIIARAMLFHIPPSMKLLQETQLEQHLLAKKAASLISRSGFGGNFGRKRHRRQQFFEIPTQMCDCVVVRAPPQEMALATSCGGGICTDDSNPSLAAIGGGRNSAATRRNILSTDYFNSDIGRDLTNNNYDVGQFCNEVCTVDQDDMDTSTTTAFPPQIDNFKRQGGGPDDFSYFNSNDNKQQCAGDTNCNPATIGCVNYSAINKSPLTRHHQPLVVSSSTYSPVKRGVFVGATVDDERTTAQQALIISNAYNNPDYYFATADPAQMNYQQQRQLYSVQYNQKSKQKQQQQPQQRPFFPSSSFDLKHYNKFNMSSPPVAYLPSSVMVIDPVTRNKLDRQHPHHHRHRHRHHQQSDANDEPPSSTAIQEQQKPSVQQQFQHRPQCPVAIAAAANRRRHESANNNNTIGDDNVFMDAPTIESEIYLIRQMLSKFIVKMAAKEANKRNAEAWRMISMVLDRVFLFGYIVSMISSLTTLFPQRPADLPDGPRYPNGTLIILNDPHQGGHYYY